MLNPTHHTANTYSEAPQNSLFRGAFKAILKLDTIHRERRALQTLDPHLLKDIGHTQASATSESRRAAWDAPARWLR